MPSSTAKPKTSAPAPAAADPTPVAGTQTGIVESDVRNKTRTVVVRWMLKHPKYGKYVRKRTVLQVHDEANESHVGDTVEVAPCRPLSKTKFYRLVRIVSRGTGVKVMHE